MNLDQFESNLRHQPLKKLPSGWKSEILAAAQKAKRVETKVKPIGRFWLELRSLLLPSPRAWAAIAAAWAVILALNFDWPSSPRMVANSHESRRIEEIITVRAEGRALLVQILEQDGPQAADRPKPIQPQRRGQAPCAYLLA